MDEFVRALKTVARDRVALKTEASVDKAQTHSLDTTGRELACRWTTDNSLDVSALKPGLYLLYVVSGKGRHTVLRFVKE